MRAAPNNRNETYEQWRSRMLRETAAFIEFGLKHPDQIEWIPKHPVGQGSFSTRLKALVWSLILSNKNLPE
jgi:hypothetical protein